MGIPRGRSQHGRRPASRFRLTPWTSLQRRRPWLAQPAGFGRMRVHPRRAGRRGLDFDSGVSWWRCACALNELPTKGALCAQKWRGSSACCFLRRHDPSRFEGSSGRAHRNLSLPRKTPLQARAPNGAHEDGASGIYVSPKTKTEKQKSRRRRSRTPKTQEPPP